MNKLFELLIPPPAWRLPVSIFSGIIIGLGIGVFQISNAISYLSDEPEACINCHVMTPEYATWNKSSHREVAKCNDCHVPHDNFLRTYMFKAQDGLRHASIFTLRAEPQIITIKEAGKVVVQENCLRCHYKQISSVSIVEVTGKNYQHGKGKLCWNCHRSVPHGKVHSLASTPNAKVPSLKPAVPDWIQKVFK